jgi:cell division protein FtsZ
MAGMGYAVMGTAVRSGDNRAIEAAQAAMASPLLEAGAIDGARGILINISGSSSLKLSEVNEASTLIQSAAHEDANIIFGAVLDETMGDEIKITMIATGFRQDGHPPQKRSLSDAVSDTASPGSSTADRTSTPRFASEEADDQDEFGGDLGRKNSFGDAVVPEPVFSTGDTSPAFVDFGVAQSETAPTGTDRIPDFVVTDESFDHATAYDQPLEEEYARIIPNPVTATAQESSLIRENAGIRESPGVNDQQIDNLDIPAFLRRGTL